MSVFHRDKQSGQTNKFFQQLVNNNDNNNVDGSCLSPCNSHKDVEKCCMKTVNLELGATIKSVSEGVFSKTFTGLNFCLSSCHTKKEGTLYSIRCCWQAQIRIYGVAEKFDLCEGETTFKKDAGGESQRRVCGAFQSWQFDGVMTFSTTCDICGRIQNGM